MIQLPDKSNNSAALDIYNPNAQNKAIDIRRKMVNYPEVAKALTEVERYIFGASIKEQIKDIDDNILVEQTKEIFRFIALDIGYIIPKNSKDWAYICTRLLTMLKRYYGLMTLADIKMAFELLIAGYLDDYLPKDSQGNPDKKHYQQFNAEYFTRVLNAYKSKQNEVISKAYKALPPPEYNISDKERVYYHNNTINSYREIFLHYKYKNKLKLGFDNGRSIYLWLNRLGIAEDVKESKDDRKQAFARYMRRVIHGYVNKYEGYYVQRNGIDCKELNYTAFEVAREKAIKTALDYMISNEMQIDNYLNYL